MAWSLRGIYGRQKKDKAGRRGVCIEQHRLGGRLSRAPKKRFGELVGEIFEESSRV